MLTKRLIIMLNNTSRNKRVLNRRWQLTRFFFLRSSFRNLFPKGSSSQQFNIKICISLNTSFSCSTITYYYHHTKYLVILNHYIDVQNNATWRTLFDNKPNLVFLPVICRSVVSVKTLLHRHLLNHRHLDMPLLPCRKENPNRIPIKELRSSMTYTLFSISFYSN